MIAKMIAKLIPRKLFFTSGVGTHPEYLESFEAAPRCRY
jgi:arginine decarboxylase